MSYCPTAIKEERDKALSLLCSDIAEGGALIQIQQGHTSSPYFGHFWYLWVDGGRRSCCHFKNNVVPMAPLHTTPPPATSPLPYCTLYGRNFHQKVLVRSPEAVTEHCIFSPEREEVVDILLCVEPPVKLLPRPALCKQPFLHAFLSQGIVAASHSFRRASGPNTPKALTSWGMSLQSFPPLQQSQVCLQSPRG